MMKAVQVQITSVSVKTPRVLDQPLLDGMRDMGRGGDIGRGTHARLVAEQPPLDALHQRGSHAAAHRLLPAESVGDDQLHDFGQPPEIEEHHAQRKGDIPQRHDRDHHPAHAGDAVNAAEDNAQRQQRQGDADPMVVEAESALPCGADRIALHRIEGEAERDGDQYGKDHAHPAPAQSPFHIIGRTADIGIPAAAFVELGEGRFDEGARSPQQGDDPHREDGSRTADGDRRGDAREIARTDAARQRDGEGLKRRDMPLAPPSAARRLPQHAEHLAQHAELHAARTHGEPYGAA